MMARNVLESIKLLANVSRLFADRCISGLVANEDRLRTLAESSPSIVTPLNSAIGYEEAAAVAKQALKEGKTIRQTVIDRGLIGENLADIRPGSPEAMRLKALLQDKGLWSQYLEVGIGPDAEVFTKAPVLASVGCGDDIGIRSDSAWNNPEPEVVLAVNSRGQIVGATLGNDVNLRDIEGRSALLLGKAKDNNASCAIGPFLRLFDAQFSIADVRQIEVSLHVQGPEGFELRGASSLAKISRDPLDLVAQGRLPQQGFVGQEQVALTDFLANRFGSVYATQPETCAEACAV